MVEGDSVVDFLASSLEANGSDTLCSERIEDVNYRPQNFKENSLVDLVASVDLLPHFLHPLVDVPTNLLDISVSFVEFADELRPQIFLNDKRLGFFQCSIDQRDKFFVVCGG